MKPQPGDRIEIFRGLYQHWALYVGDGDVVHLTGEPGPGSVSNSSGFSGSGSGSGGTATVKREKLQKVAGKNKWKINNKLDKARKPRPAKVIVREACARVGSTQKYDVFSENCEHFVNELCYGVSYSEQVRNFMAGLTGASLVAAAVIGVLAAVRSILSRN